MGFKDAINRLAEQAAATNADNAKQLTAHKEREEQAKNRATEREKQIKDFKARISSRFEELLQTVAHSGLNPSLYVPQCDIVVENFTYTPVAGVQFIHPKTVQKAEHQIPNFPSESKQRTVWVFWAVTNDSGRFGYLKDVQALIDFEKKIPENTRGRHAFKDAYGGYGLLEKSTKLSDLARLKDEDLDAQLEEIFDAAWDSRRPKSPKAH